MFYRDGLIFNPPDAPSFVKLSYPQLIALKDNIEGFLWAAEEVGLSLSVKKALKILEQEIAYYAPRQSFWKSYFRLPNLNLLFVTLCVIWTFYSWWQAILFAYPGSLFLEGLIKTVRSAIHAIIVHPIEKENAIQASRILRKMNSTEIDTQLQWAREHLENIGWIKK